MKSAGGVTSLPFGCDFYHESLPAPKDICRASQCCFSGMLIHYESGCVGRRRDYFEECPSGPVTEGRAFWADVVVGSGVCDQLVQFAGSAPAGCWVKLKAAAGSHVRIRSNMVAFNTPQTRDEMTGISMICRPNELFEDEPGAWALLCLWLSLPSDPRVPTMRLAETLSHWALVKRAGLRVVTGGG